MLDRYINGERDPETPFVSWEIGPLSLPIDCLSWRARLVDLVGRDDDRQRLLDWARSDSRIAVRYLMGSPGVGKTRLAAEVADTLQQDGWSAGFVDWRDLGVWRVGEAGAFLVLDDVPPVLDTNWLDLADAASQADPSWPKVRLLIVARNPVDERFDWRQLRQRGLTPRRSSSRAPRM